MAANLEIYIKCGEFSDVRMLLKGLNANEIKAIDNWTWENESEITIDAIEPKVNEGKIAIILFSGAYANNCGIYIEKQKEIYKLSVWASTENMPWLEADCIGNENENFYEKMH